MSRQASSSRFWHGLRRVVVHPVTTILLAGSLVASYLSLSYSPLSGGSGFKGFVERKLASYARSTVHWGDSRLYVIREPQGFRTIDPELESWDELSRIIDQRPRDVAEAVYSDRRFRSGFWAPTRRTHDVRIRLMPMAGEWTLQEEAQVRRLFAAALSGERHVEPAVLTPAGLTTSTIIWTGVAHNAAALTAFALLILSLAWIPESVRRFRARKRERAIARGVCPNCGYVVRGLPDGVCPECGGRAR